MTIIVEDGSVVEGANSYNSLEQADEYFSVRNVTSWADMDQAAKEAALIYGAEALDASRIWNGTPVTNSQSLAWPRFGVVDSAGRLIPSNVIPVNIMHSQLELALMHNENALNVVVRESGIKKIQAGRLVKEFYQGGSQTTFSTQFAYLNRLLFGLGDPVDEVEGMMVDLSRS